MMAGTINIISGYQTDRSEARATIEIAAATATRRIATTNK